MEMRWRGVKNVCTKLLLFLLSLAIATRTTEAFSSYSVGRATFHCAQTKNIQNHFTYLKQRRQQQQKQHERFINHQIYSKSFDKLDEISSTLENDIESPSSSSASTLQSSGFEEDYKRGLLIIAFITLLFSSNSPVLHAAFVKVSQPPPVLLLNAAASVVALVGLLFGGQLLDAAVPLPCTLEEDAMSRCDDTLTETSVKAGFELGLWKMLGATVNLYGLSLTSADHGAFLIQLTTLFVPVVQGIRGVPIPTRIWTAIALALSGVFLFTQEPAGAGQSASLLGDGLCVLSAVFYATYDLRLFDWGKKVAPLRLITNKIATQAALSFAVLVAFNARESIDYISNLVSSGSIEDALLVSFVALWSGIVISAFAPFLQVSGQQAIGPSRAQVIYASQPLWAALISWAWLDETVGIQGFVGGSLFLVAMFLAATAEAPDPNCEQDICEV